MGGIKWLLLGVGPLLLIGAASKYLLRQFRIRKQRQFDRIDQLGNRLSEQLVELPASSDQVLSCEVSQKILKSLRDSEQKSDGHNHFGFSSIDPVEESLVLVSDRLASLDAQLNNENDLATLSLAALAVIYVRSHITESIRVKEMAHKLRVSRIKLNSFLNQTLGCSAQVLVNVIKMQEAKRLLKIGDLLVKEVAFHLGYMNPYHFSARFKMFFGVSPSSFQKHYHNQKSQDKACLSDSYQVEDQSSPSTDPAPDESDHSLQLAQNSIDDIQPLPEGTKIDRFLIVNLIGRGGMGVVYRAYDPRLNRGIALKLIRADRANSTTSQNRLLREAQALARLSHPNVLHVYDVGTFGDKVFMAMALVEGQTLKEWLRFRRRSVKEVLQVMKAAGQGLSAAHKAGLVHRDFKPGNVIVGNDNQVKVLDFGLACVASAESQAKNRDDQQQRPNTIHDLGQFSSESGSNLLHTPLTRAGHILGTPLYMAPEQHLGIATDERTDLFSFCVVLYEALYGKRPFYAKTFDDLKSEVIRQQILTPPADSQVPGWLWQIIRKGLSADPKDRYTTIESLLDDLENDPEEASRQLHLARKRRLSIISLITFTIVLPFGIWYGLRYRSFESCKDSSQEFAGVWDDATKESVQKAFSATKKSFAQWTWRHVEKTIDKYTDQWVEMRADVCDARLNRGTQSQELFDLRMSCLHQRIVELNALMKVFSKADSSVVQKAVQASVSLKDITNCADEKALRAPYPPPSNAQQKASVQAIRDRLAVVEALIKTGKYPEGMRLAKNIMEEAEKTKYLPIQAETKYYLGFMLERAGEFNEAETTLYDAEKEAGKTGDFLLVAKSMVWLTVVVGFHQARYQEGLLIGRHAEVMLDAIKGDVKLRSKLLNNMGTIYLSKAEYDKALEHYRKSVAITMKELGPEHSQVAIPMGNIGIVYLHLGEYEKALAHYRGALEIWEKTLGPEHPSVASMLNNIAGVLFKKEDFDKALEFYQKSLSIQEEALGSDHPYIARALFNIGDVYLSQGNYDKALKFLYRAQRIWSAVLGPEHPNLAWSLSAIGKVYIHQKTPQKALKPLEQAVLLCQKKACANDAHGNAMFQLAQALVLTKSDQKRAIDLVKQAKKLLGATPKAFSKELEEMNVWLRKTDK